MSELQFSVRNFGSFASSKRPVGLSKAHLMVNYEFEFYTDDCPGGDVIDGVYYPARQGMVTLAKPGQMVQLHHPYKCYYMNIVAESPEVQELLNGLPEQFPVWNMDEIVEHLQQMILQKPAVTPYQKLRIQSHAYSIIAILSRCGQKKDQAVHGAIQHQKILLTADKYMSNHIAEKIALEDLAKMSNLDPTYFHKLYTAAFGVSPAQRLLRYRIKAAKRGLLSSNVSLSDLAEKCGFSSQAYFCYKFRQATGMTPTQYRSEMLSRVEHE